MEDYDFNEKRVEGIETGSAEEGFMKGYLDEEEIAECSECGSALREDSTLSKEIDGEEFHFCSKTCAREFKESTS